MPWPTSKPGSRITTRPHHSLSEREQFARRTTWSGACANILSIEASAMVQGSSPQRHESACLQVNVKNVEAWKIPKSRSHFNDGPRSVVRVSSLLTHAPTSVGMLGCSASMKRDSFVSLGTERSSSLGRALLVGLWQRAGTALRDGGYRCNASTVHDGSFTRHRGPPLGQTFLVSNVQPAISISNAGGWRQCNVRVLVVTRAVPTPAGHLRGCAVRERHTRSSGGLSVWRLWTRSPSSSELLCPGRYEVRHTCLSRWWLSCGFDDRLGWLFPA